MDDLDTKMSTGAERENAGEKLIRRAPKGYLWNQASALWLFVSLLLFEVVVRRSLNADQTTTFDFGSTMANLGFYVASLGLASASLVFIPRALAQGGLGHARALALRLVAARMILVAVVGVLVVLGLPVLAQLGGSSGFTPASELVKSAGFQMTLEHRYPIAAYVVTTGASTILSTLLIALLRTRLVFIVGGIGQLLLIGCTYFMVRSLHAGVDGALYAQSLPMVFTTAVYGVLLNRQLGTKSDRAGTRLFLPSVRLGIASWLADLPQNSLVQPVALGQLVAVPAANIPFFKSTYQMGDAGARFFTEGLGGVSTATMSAAYANNRRDSLALGWRTVNKLQVLLAIPLVAFCVPFSSTIMALLFGSRYAAAGGLMAFFLLANGLLQLLGGATHEWALYVLGNSRWVVISRWITLGVLALSGAVLVPQFFALGALLAVALGRLVAQILLLVVARVKLRRPYPVSFAARMLVSLVAPVAAIVLWQASGIVPSLFGSLHTLSSGTRGLAEEITLLASAALIFVPLFLLSLRLLRPLDAQDAELLELVPGWLRSLLLPFASDRSVKAV